MPDPITISALLASVGINLASELLVRGTDIASRRSSVQRAIISTSDRFSTRVLGLRAALEAWVGNEDFRSELDALKNGQSTRSDADHIDIFIAKSGLQGGTIDNVVASEILTHFYSELWRELCGSNQGQQLIGVRISSMDQEVNRKLDSLLGRLPPQPTFQMTPRQQIVCRSLEQKSQELAVLYESALRILSDEANPGRLRLAAHSVRELMNGLPNVLDLPILDKQGRLGDQVSALEPVWDRATNSQCHQQGEWSGQIDGPVQKLFKSLHTFFEWWKSSRPKRRNTAAVLFRTMDPSGLPLPEPLEKKRVDRWLALHDFFVSVAHGALKEEQEIVAAVEEVEQILRDSLYPEPSEDLSAIDAILAEELLGD